MLALVLLVVLIALIVGVSLKALVGTLFYVLIAVVLVGLIVSAYNYFKNRNRSI